MNQADLAQLAGTSRESVSRFLATLERAGVVHGGTRAGHRGRAAPPARLHILAVPAPDRRRRVRVPARAAWSSASFAGAASATSGCSRRWPRSPGSASCPSAMRGAAPMTTRPCRSAHDQTISQPWIVAAICQALELTGRERVLEVGTGSGYSAAVLARLAREVITVERMPELAEPAPGPPSPRSASPTSRWSSATAAPACPTARRSTRSPSHASRPGTAARRSSRPARARRPPGGSDRRTPCRHAHGVPPSRRDGGPRHRRGPEREVIGPCRFVPLIGAEGFPSSDFRTPLGWRYPQAGR